jgi:hypothetical protein
MMKSSILVLVACAQLWIPAWFADATVSEDFAPDLPKGIYEAHGLASREVRKVSKPKRLRQNVANQGFDAASVARKMKAFFFGGRALSMPPQSKGNKQPKPNPSPKPKPSLKPKAEKETPVPPGRALAKAEKIFMPEARKTYPKAANLPMLKARKTGHPWKDPEPERALSKAAKRFFKS